MAQRGYGAPIGREWGSDDDRDFPDNRVRDRDERWRNRERGDERGFFERAGDEVRSWFDDEDDRRNERDFGSPSGRTSRSWDSPSASGRHDRDEFSRSSQPYGRSERDFGGSRDWDRSRPSMPSQRSSEPDRWQSGMDRTRDIGDRDRQSDDSQGPMGVLVYEEFTGTLGGFGDQRMGRPEDQLYRNWRDRQIRQLDREYQEYCREREQQFQQGFDQWRRNRRDSMGEKGELQLGAEGSGTREITESTGESKSSGISESSNEPQASRNKSGSRTKS